MVAAQSYPLCTNPACDEREDNQSTKATTSADSSSDNKINSNHPKCELSLKCVEACAAYGRVCPCTARAAGRAACAAVTKLRQNSNVFPAADDNSGDPTNNFIKLNADDLIIGAKLGEGGFSLVNECTLKTDPDKKIAIKYLKRKVMVNQHHFEHGAADLAQEAHFLSVLHHKNIIRLHGVTAGSVQTNVATGKECGFFITVDRLYDTLETRLAQWRDDQEKVHNGIFVRMSSDYKEKKKQELRQRLKIALQIADAIEYLHDKNIIFRDLKPDNIGFDVDGVLKVFDFGLAKELKPGEGNADGRYELTGNTGSRRYMAPEVAKELPYNKSVDAYSFGIMLHELLSAEKPFYGYSSGKHMSLVVVGGERPKMEGKLVAGWPMDLQWLMKRCWSPFPTSRPDFALIKQTLQTALDSIESSSDCPAIPNSQHVLLQERAISLDSSSGTTDGTHSTTTITVTTGTGTPACKKQIIAPPAGGFASLLRPKRSKGKSHGSTNSHSPTRSTSSPVKVHSPTTTTTTSGKRGMSLGWFTKR